ncbi:MAG TPA: aldehyde dehydrogenase EutE [bacterium]|nr:aldehyde dehydrogenase EutE [bacterium]HOL92984.1 aldehyde dehydrogenase EutE [bacterium]HPO99336.1 aldehyde dehydrogenase EutE [bacterium]HXK93367.1 aldehyde dehydrogenase EutE [bacterium]
MDDRQIAEIVRRVMQELQNQAQVSPPHVAACAGGAVSGGRDGVFEDIEQAIQAAKQAFLRFREVPLEDRKRFIQVIRDTSRQLNRDWAELTVRDTGMGRADHKVLKNSLALEKTPGPEELTTTCVTGDHGIMLQEYAPFGVIGTITPSTNPVATVINHAIAMLSAGNTVVFGPHPGAVQCTLESMQAINRALVAAGAPANLLTSVRQPSLRTAKIIMGHEDISLLVATGGPAVVRAALESPKRAIVAGPGNPPVIVDETADIGRAAQNIYDGSSFDNNMPCICEKECFVLPPVYDDLISAMRQRGAYMLSAAQTDALTRVTLTAEGHVNRDFVGKDAAVLARAINLQIPSNCELLLADVTKNHPFVTHEMLMPVLAIVKVNTFEEAVSAAVEAEHGFGHTAIIHSRRMDRITQFAKAIQVNLFVANGPCGAILGNGGEGWTAFTIAGPTGEGPCTPKTFSRVKRFAIADSLRVV